VEDILLTQGIAVFAASLHEDPERERSIVRKFLRRRVDGLILSTVGKNQSYLFSEIERGTPIVFVDRAPNGIEVDTVTSSNAEGAAAATRHLMEAGHRRIAYLGDDMDIQTAREGNRGFLQGLSRTGITVVAQNPQRIGELAAERALARMQGEDLPPETIIVPPTLRPRESREMPPYVD
jgi:LacI family transcriptional regulator